ncbi:MAG: hypothetical protein AAFP78_15200 [Pseudomonadota bacterium]
MKNKGPTAELDPRALIVEAYRMEGIAPEDCRSIYFDWALGLDAARDMKADTAALLAHHEPAEPDHPMTAVLREGLANADAPKRRGGRRSRV